MRLTLLRFPQHMHLVAPLNDEESRKEYCGLCWAPGVDFRCDRCGTAFHTACHHARLDPSGGKRQDGVVWLDTDDETEETAVAYLCLGCRN